jgi:NADP-reducing hydrogenase subunit HndD
MTKKGLSDIDAVITTRELAKLIKLYGIDMNQIEAEAADEPFGTRSSSGKMFGSAGGMTEAVMRTMPYITGGREPDRIKYPELRGIKGKKEASLKTGKTTYRFAVISGLENAASLLEGLRAGNCEYDFVEIMACAGGCINGGGQPIGAEENAVRARMKALYGIDEREIIRLAHKNPVIKELYRDFLGRAPGR